MTITNADMPAPTRCAPHQARRLDWPTAGLAPGVAQANLVVLPQATPRLPRFCAAQPVPCPVLQVTDPGIPEPVRVRAGADLRTDLRATASTATARSRRARRHPTTGATTSSRSCSAARSRSSGAPRRGLPVRHLEQRGTSRCSAPSIASRPAGIFSGPARGLDAPDARGRRSARRRSPRALPAPRRAGAHRRPRGDRHRRPRRSPTGATRSTSAPARCPCSGPAA